ncbi:MAG: response regulator transcription factor [SAR202 cluster bacterium]|nr:DNA-binding response regulator [Chloroflexota bacterium]MQG50991.1 response regulator transcription factor [SAR202 cluster bacterium]|tara:strand:- start:221 stop:934 length:714 start_codon:yes stop_codon:yes gene_type:complete
MKKNKILIVEDETNIADSVKLNLEAEGYEVEYTTDGQMGLHYARTLNPDLIILDIMLPKLDGFEVNKIIQKELSIPVIFLTAKSDEISTVLGLELGADDYISKPFSMRELISRVKAVLRRLENTKSHSISSQINNNPQKGKFIYDDIEIDIDGRRVLRNGNLIHLKPKEFEILVYLSSNQGMAISRDTLLDKIWGIDYFGDKRTVDVHLRWLRKKIELDSQKPKHLITVRNVGYRFD